MGACLYKNELNKVMKEDVDVENLTNCGIYHKTSDRSLNIKDCRKNMRVRSIKNSDSSLILSRLKKGSNVTMGKLARRRSIEKECRPRNHISQGYESADAVPREFNTSKTSMKYLVDQNYLESKQNIELNDIEEEIDDGNTYTDCNMQYVDKEITQEEEEKIKKALRGHFLFKETTDEMMHLIMEELIEFQLEQGRFLYEEGDNGNYFYILKNGVLEVTVKDERKGVHKDWDCFGELALLQKCTRTETVKCLTSAEVFILNGESFRELLSKIHQIKLKYQLEFLDLVPTFKSLNSIEKNNIVSYLNTATFEAGDAIIREGDVGYKMYIIKEGCVTCRSRNREIRKLYEKEYFGQNCILLDTRRSLDVIALVKTVVFELSRQSLEEAFGQTYRETILFSNFKDFIAKSEFFREVFIESQLDMLFRCFSMKVYKNGELVYNKETKDNKKIIVIIEGNLIKEKSCELLAKRGEVYGEEVLKGNEDSNGSLLAYTDSIFLEAPLEQIIKNLNMSADNKSLNIFNRVNKLKKINIFKNLSEPKLLSLAKFMKKLKFLAGNLIIEENTQGSQFYLITTGRVRVTQNGKLVRELEENNCFGEIAVINRDIRTATVHAITNVICYQITQDDFENIFDYPFIKEYLIKKISLQDTSILLKSLYYFKFLGKGKFGSVSLVHNGKNVYAIKAVSRKAADRQKILSRYFASERRIMLQLDHPFIIKMVKSLKNEQFCFFLLEFVNGTNMDDFLNERKTRRNIFETKFYIACMLVMIDYLHKKGIAHRDIKPSNIMIDQNGYLKLIDFGTAKKITDFTHTIIGTPHYIAPEILLGRGYSFSCDYWSIGICMFEIFYGCYPFGNQASEVLEVYKDIMHKEIVFPQDISKQSGEVKGFIKVLLSKKFNQRVCNLTKLKQTPLFVDFSWDDLIDFKMKPPFVHETWDWTKNIGSALTKFEDALQSTKESQLNWKSTEVDDPFAHEYDKRWADEF